MTVKSLLKEVSDSLTPTKEESAQLDSQTKHIISVVSKHLKSYKPAIVVGGSVRKGTALRHTHEVDIFIQFPKKYAKSPISDIVHSKLSKTFRMTRLHGSRDYFSISHNNIEFELIPIVKISKADHAHNITDISPLHATWVRTHAKKLRDEIRLTKALMRASHIYGAESYIQGFSGYACEILTIHYKGFLPLLRAAQKWKTPQVIDPQKFYKKSDPLLELNKSKITGPLVLIDPVQKERNVTSAVSAENFTKFIQTSKKFLKSPSKSHFIPPLPNKNDILQNAPKNTLALFLTVNPKSNKPDVMGAVALKKFHSTNKFLEENQFKVISSDWHFDGKVGVLWFYIKKTTPKPQKHYGPSKKYQDHYKQFKKKYPKAKKSGSKLVIILPPKFKSPQLAIKHLSQTADFKYKLSSSKVLWL